LSNFVSVASRARKFFSYIVNAAKFCSEGIFFPHGKKKENIFDTVIGCTHISGLLFSVEEATGQPDQ
jgi:hypothetical protein